MNLFKKNINFNKTVISNTDFLKELRQKLPNFFSKNIYDEDGCLIEEGKFDLEKFKRNLEERDVEELKSGYQLNFIGKDYAKKQAGENSTTVIVPNTKHNLKEENNKSQNLFFTGDNLEVLRHLQSNYSKSVDMIYIDPPYNTGKDGFTYPDKFEYSDEILKDMFAINEEELVKMKSIQGKATHSAWLTFLYPRLYLAKKLLKDNGVIFISIDDNEQVNLKYLMDEIFGESNFMSILPRITSPQRFHQEKNVNISHDYIMVYGKTLSSSLGNLIDEDRKQEKELKKDHIGHYYEGDTKAILAPRSQGYSEGGDYDYSYNGKTFKPIDRNGVRNRWFWVKERMDAAAELGILRETSNNSIRMQIYQDIKFDDKTNKMVPKEMGVRLTSRDLLQNKYSNPNGVGDLEKYEMGNVFTNPKPVELLKTLIKLMNNKDGLIMDFFAGSASTADAVMKLNNEDDGKRKYIMVQKAEKTYIENDDGTKIAKKNSKEAFDEGYLTIDEISRERIKRASKEIQKEKTLVSNQLIDTGFKHYYVVPPSQLTLNDIEAFNVENNMFESSLGQFYELPESGFDDMIRPFSSKSLEVSGNASGEESILTTWMVFDGYKFEVEIETIELSGYKSYYVDETRLYIIERGWGAEQTKELVNLIGTNQLSLQTLVLYGYTFDLESIREIEIGIKQLDKKINIIKRY